MPVRFQFLRTAVARRDQGSCDRCHRLTSRKDFLEQRCSETQTGSYELHLDRMSQIVVGDLMGQDATQLLVIGFLQETGCYDELSSPRAAGVNVRVGDDFDANFIQTL